MCVCVCESEIEDGGGGIYKYANTCETFTIMFVLKVAYWFRVYICGNMGVFRMLSDTVEHGRNHFWLGRISVPCVFYKMAFMQMDCHSG